MLQPKLVGVTITFTFGSLFLHLARALANHASMAAAGAAGGKGGRGGSGGPERSGLVLALAAGGRAVSPPYDATRGSSAGSIRRAVTPSDGDLLRAAVDASRRVSGWGRDGSDGGGDADGRREERRVQREREEEAERRRGWGRRRERGEKEGRPGREEQMR